MPFHSALLRPDSLSSWDGGAKLSVRLPWMRSLPWASVHRIDVEVGDESVPADSLRLILDRQTVGLRDLQSEAVGGFWVVGRPVDVLIPLKAPARPGEVIDVSVAVEVSIPYLVSPSGEPVHLPFRARAELRAS